MTIIRDVIAVELGTEDDSISWDKGVPTVLQFLNHGAGEWLQIHHGQSQQVLAAGGPLNSELVWKATEKLFFVKLPLQGGSQRLFALRCASSGVAALLDNHLKRVLDLSADNKKVVGNHFGRKTDDGSAALYFHYYGMLQHQQNMLQDYVRTGAYWNAIVKNSPDFLGKTVMDVGAGSGILSLFAAQAGAKRVYAIEASQMASFAEELKSSNPALGPRITVLHSKVEELKLADKVDILVSEPMGTLLVNERMLETYLYARDHFLKPGGLMFPNLGRIHVAGFCDEVLHMEVGGKATFWTAPNYYGVDLRVLHKPAVQSYYSQVVVDAFDPNILVTGFASREFNFNTIREEELHRISMPLNLPVAVNGVTRVHGLACWFDVQFKGTLEETWLSTAPGQPTTHWFQLRCVLAEPLQVWPGCVLTGEFRLEAHNRQSYDIFLNLMAPPVVQGGPPQQSHGKFDLKDPYYRQLNSWVAAPQPLQEAPAQDWGRGDPAANGAAWAPQSGRW